MHEYHTRVPHTITTHKYYSQVPRTSTTHEYLAQVPHKKQHPESSEVMLLQNPSPDTVSDRQIHHKAEWHCLTHPDTLLIIGVRQALRMQDKGLTPY